MALAEPFLVRPLAAADQVLLDVDAGAGLHFGSGLHGRGVTLSHPAGHQHLAAGDALPPRSGDIVFKALGACVH